MSMAAYSQDLRERVLNACERGESPAAIAKRLEVSVSWVRSVYQRYKETGERRAHRVGGYRVSRLADWEGEIKAWIAEKPDMTLAEIVEHLNENSVKIAISSLWERLNQWGLSFKKKPSRPGTRTSRRSGSTSGMANPTSQVRLGKLGVLG
jgi:transposase